MEGQRSGLQHRRWARREAVILGTGGGLTKTRPEALAEWQAGPRPVTLKERHGRWHRHRYDQQVPPE
ncbi:hypothetical protein NDU88_006007 [Pleurodeles waltl]|uniref:Uncharacterized protein n=1 Tax=Pleurodeles waltl TaxID=8319 RepID=A0AAV7SNB1_PLEWA|nr:hypothetical protein NDU88_006007 [Pleurodeles waltl]